MAFSERFAEIESPVHRLDPSVRLAGAAFFCLAAAIAQTWQGAGAALAAALGLAFAARLPFGAVLGRLAVANAFVLFMWVFVPFTYPGRQVFSLWSVGATAEGLRVCLLLTIKANAVMLGFMALVSGVAVNDMGPALQRLRVPAKLCLLLVFTFRYVHVLEQERRRLLRAAKARCFAPDNSRHTYRTYAHLVGMLLVRSWDRAERVWWAMLCRGYQGRFPCMRSFRTKGRDWAFLAASFLFSLGLFLWDRFSI